MDRQTDGGQAVQEGPPSTQENLSPWVDARASPLQQPLSSARRGKNGVLHHFSSLRTGLEGAFGRGPGALLVSFPAPGALSVAPCQGGNPLLDRFSA